MTCCVYLAAVLAMIQITVVIFKKPVCTTFQPHNISESMKHNLKYSGIEINTLNKLIFWQNVNQLSSS